MPFSYRPWFLLSAFLTFGSLRALAQTPLTFPLWPGQAPGEQGDPSKEIDTTKPTDALIAGKRVIRLGGITQPTLTVYPAPRDKDTGTAVVVCPGGGYRILAMDLEGTEVCSWFNSIGVTAFLLKYRVPPQPGAEPYAAPLQDVQRAVGLIRSRAKEWQIAPERIGVLGFSAGGHLAAALSTNCGERTYPPLDAADQTSCRPDFCLLIYPAYLTRKTEGDAISPELKITAQTPPSFLVQAEDDAVRVETSLYYYLALKKALVPAELHVYPTGGHGYGLRVTEKAITKWPVPAEEWMRGRGLLKRL